MALDVGGRHADAERARTSGSGACRTPTARGTRTTWATRSRTRRSTRTSRATSRPASGTTTSPPATPRSCASTGPSSSAPSTTRSSYQTETGEIAWRADDPADGALLTGSSSIHHSPALRDRDRRAPRSRPSRLGALGRRARDRDRAPARALPRQGPLGDGLVLPDPRRRAPRPARADAGRRAAGTRSWCPGRGVRCVSDQPWVTAAETCELVMALDAIGETERAHDLFAWVQFLRHDDGCYWCGMNFDGEPLPRARRVLHRGPAHVELRGRRARRARARWRGPDRGPVPRRGPPRRALRRRAPRGRRRDRVRTRVVADPSVQECGPSASMIRVAAAIDGWRTT